MINKNNNNNKIDIIDSQSKGKCENLSLIIAL